MYIYDDTENNLRLELKTTFDKKFDKYNELRILYITSREKDNKPIAKQGLTRKILCDIVKELLNKKDININSDISLEAERINFKFPKGKEFDKSKLIKMYKNMGFEIISGKEMSMTVKDLINWCNKTY